MDGCTEEAGMIVKVIAEVNQGLVEAQLFVLRAIVAGLVKLGSEQLQQFRFGEVFALLGQAVKFIEGFMDTPAKCQGVVGQGWDFKYVSIFVFAATFSNAMLSFSACVARGPKPPTLAKKHFWLLAPVTLMR